MERADLVFRAQDWALWFPGSLYVIQLLQCRIDSGYEYSRVERVFSASLVFQSFLGVGLMNGFGKGRRRSLCETGGASVEAYYDERMRESGLPSLGRLAQFTRLHRHNVA